jgi:AcrR family transcriptional regulator
MSTVKTRILEAAAELIADSPDAEISTRAVCEAAGVSAPSIYHYFGDKEGLLAAVVDFTMECFLERKREAAAAVHDDVADDLRAGWDNHIQFARENPGMYRLLWSPAVSRESRAAAEGHEMLRIVLERGASLGQLRMSVETATRVVMAAVTGAALSMVSQPELFGDGAFADTVREAVIAAVLVSSLSPPAAKRHKRTNSSEPTLASTAATLQSMLGHQPATLTEAERALMQQWLSTLADAPTGSRIPE